MNLTYRSLLIPIIAITLGVSGCGDKNAADKRKDASQRKSKYPRVTLVRAILDRPVYKVTLPGELAPYEQVTIYAKVKSFVKEIRVDRGSRVKKGQLLVVLDAPEVTQSYFAARSDESKEYGKYIYSRQVYARIQKASQKPGAIAAVEIDKAYSQLLADSAAYMAAKEHTAGVEQLTSYLRIDAPFDGTVIDKNVSDGALVGEDGPKDMGLFTIVERQRLRLTVAIPEKQSHSITKNTRLKFTVNDLPGRTFDATLSRSGGLVIQKDRSVIAEFDVDNKDMTLNGGEYATLQLVLQRPDSTVWVPQTSIVHAQSGVFLLKFNRDTVSWVFIQEGLLNGSSEEIFGRVGQGDSVVLNGTEELLTGDSVVIIITKDLPEKKDF
jgi:RND family efflux transporter MFP subunit